MKSCEVLKVLPLLWKVLQIFQGQLRSYALTSKQGPRKLDYSGSLCHLQGLYLAFLTINSLLSPVFKLMNTCWLVFNIWQSNITAIGLLFCSSNFQWDIKEAYSLLYKRLSLTGKKWFTPWPWLFLVQGLGLSIQDKGSSFNLWQQINVYSFNYLSTRMQQRKKSTNESFCGCSGVVMHKSGAHRVRASLDGALRRLSRRRRWRVFTQWTAAVWVEIMWKRILVLTGEWVMAEVSEVLMLLTEKSYLKIQTKKWFPVEWGWCYNNCISGRRGRKGRSSGWWCACITEGVMAHMLRNYH